MLTGQDVHTLNKTAAFDVHGMNLSNWEEMGSDVQKYYERFAELVNAHFTGTATVTPEPLAMDAIEMLTKMPEEKQALVYSFLHKIGHRIYK